VSRAAVAFLILLVALLAGGCGDDESAEEETLAGTSWVLVSGVPVPEDLPVTMPTAAFTTDTVSGTGGCNRFTGSYSVDGGSIELGALATTEIACPAPAEAIERSYYAALQDVSGWGVDEDDLVLTDADDAELLRFEPAPTS
jgi:heat shock protein HslJ